MPPTPDTLPSRQETARRRGLVRTTLEIPADAIGYLDDQAAAMTISRLAFLRLVILDYAASKRVLRIKDRRSTPDVSEDAEPTEARDDQTADLFS